MTIKQVMEDEYTYYCACKNVVKQLLLLQQLQFVIAGAAITALSSAFFYKVGGGVRG